MHTIVPIHKAGDVLDPGTYRTIMIGHVLAKLYGAILEEELSTCTEAAGMRVREQALDGTYRQWTTSLFFAV